MIPEKSGEVTNRTQLALIRLIKVGDRGTPPRQEGLRPIKVPIVAPASSSKIKRKGKANVFTPGFLYQGKAAGKDPCSQALRIPRGKGPNQLGV